MVSECKIKNWLTKGVKDMEASNQKKMKIKIKMHFTDPVQGYNLNDLWLATSPDADLTSFVDFYWPKKHLSIEKLLQNEFGLKYDSTKN